MKITKQTTIGYINAGMKFYTAYTNLYEDGSVKYSATYINYDKNPGQMGVTYEYNTLEELELYCGGTKGILRPVDQTNVI